MSTQPSSQTDNPLGLNLDFMFGRGYLWAKEHRVSDWIALESLRMEIPDLQFPFDARGGLDRFRHTRCLVRDIEVAVSEVGLGDLLAEAASGLDGYDDLQVRFIDDAAHISFRLSSLGTDSWVSFRAALIPPEPARADEVHLSLYDYRAFGPLPYPARLVVNELVKGLLESPQFRAPGQATGFAVGMAGDIISFRPLKLLLLHIFPKVGWKLPNLAGVVLQSAKIRPGVVTLRAVDEDPASAAGAGGGPQLSNSREGARALAAYEAKELFSHADRALFEGDVRQAMSLLSDYRDAYGMNPALIERQLDCLLADASAGHVAEAEAIRRELLREDSESVQAALANPTIALARRRRDEAIDAYRQLAELLHSREETRDWMLCELTVADLLEEDEPREAARRLREVLKRDPRHRPALIRLRELYERTGERAGLEEMLKRLTGVYTDRDRLKETYLQLAMQLMDRQGDLAEARMYLEKVLRLEPTHLEALHALGRSYAMSDQPLRALKAFGSAARAARSEGHPRLAAKLFIEVGALWLEELEDEQQALLVYRQAIAALDELDDPPAKLQFRVFRAAAEASEQLGRNEDATDLWQQAAQLLEGELSQQPEQFPGSDDAGVYDDEEFDAQQQLLRAHRALGRIYVERDRASAAASHFRRVLQMQPGEQEALSWLEEHLRQGGRPEELIQLYKGQIRELEGPRQLELIEKLADLYAALDMRGEAIAQYRRLLRNAPGRGAAREKLVRLLIEEEQYNLLFTVLERLVETAQDRTVQRTIWMELGEAAEAVGELERAADAYLEAAELQVGDRQALEQACAVLQQIIDDQGRDAQAGRGEQTVGQLLEETLAELAEVTPSVDQQREVLLQVAMLAEERGDTASAREARRRAGQLEPETGDRSFNDVDARLDAMLEELGDEGSEETASPPRPSMIAKNDADDREAPTEEKLDSFRRQFAKVVKKPSELPKPDDIEKRATVAGARGRNDGDGSSLADRDSGPETLRMPVDQFETLREESSNPELDEDSGDSTGDDGDDERRSGWTMTFSSDGAPPEELQEDTSPKVEPEKMAREGIEAARRSGDSSKLATAIEHLLTLAESSDQQMLSDDEIVELSKEAGELRYYELDDAERARPHLQRVRDLEPKGRGANPEVVNALESIYEESGDDQARLKLLNQRLEAAESAQMKTTYRLLIAQTLWDRFGDGKRARRRLQEVLQTDGTHQGAHRLLASIARSDEDWESVAEHLEVVVAAGEGGIEAVETRRELATLLLRQLDDPEGALEHFRGVLDAAPGDAKALNGVKEAQGMLDDWEGYLETLGRELGLLVGQPEGLDAEAMAGLSEESVGAAVRIPASDIVADAAHVVQHQLGDDQTARTLWGVAYRLWPEHAEALEKRIELNRRADAYGDLAHDLEAYAGLVLDENDRFNALVEAADIRAKQLDDAEGARPLYTEALALAREGGAATEEAARVRRQLERLDAGQ